MRKKIQNEKEEGMEDGGRGKRKKKKVMEKSD